MDIKRSRGNKHNTTAAAEHSAHLSQGSEGHTTILRTCVDAAAEALGRLE
jgi:hypothetical protein